MARQKLNRTVLETARNWLLNEVIPGFQRQRDQESIRQSVIQLNEIEVKLAKIRYPRVHQFPKSAGKPEETRGE